jgi:hypothetical protein
MTAYFASGGFLTINRIASHDLHPLPMLSSSSRPCWWSKSVGVSENFSEVRRRQNRITSNMHLKLNNEKAEIAKKKIIAVRKQGTVCSKRRPSDIHASPISAGLPCPGSEAWSLPPVVPLEVEGSCTTSATLVFFFLGCPSFPTLDLFFEFVLGAGGGISSTSGS